MAYTNKPSHGGFNASTFLSAIAGKSIIIITVLVVIVVAVAVVCSFLLQPDRLVTQKTEAIAADYYEKYFYEHMLQSDGYNGDPSAALSKYHAAGLSSNTLEQIILLLGYDSSDDAKYLRGHCDTAETAIRFYPDPPYERNSYHTDIVYSCDF